MSRQPHFLVTNDDGIHSQFLLRLADALAARGRVTIAAPAQEQSWIGRAISHRRRLQVKTIDGLAGRAFAIDGTPTDCVNLAMGHLLGDDRPDVVCSGINVGFNCSMPILLSSGTFAGAIEGCAWGCTAVAFSLAVAPSFYDGRLNGESALDGLTASSLEAAAQHAARLAETLAGETNPTPGLVHNINFPVTTTAETPVEATQPMWIPAPPWFQPGEDGTYGFQFPLASLDRPLDGDVGAILGGRISHSRLNLRDWSNPRAPNA